MNEFLLRELAELEGGELHKHLLKRRQEIVDGWTSSDDDRRDLISKGEKRNIDDLIQMVEGAKEALKQHRPGAKAARGPMSHAF